MLIGFPCICICVYIMIYYRIIIFHRGHRGVFLRSGLVSDDMTVILNNVFLAI